MKRPLFVVTIGSLIGIIWGLYLKKSIALLFVFFICYFVIESVLRHDFRIPNKGLTFLRRILNGKQTQKRQ